MRTLVIGDVHGCLAELDELLKLVEFKQGEDRLVFVGDLVDRGPDSVGVVRRAIELKADCVLGNHEEKHLRWRRHSEKAKTFPKYKNPMRPMTFDRMILHTTLTEDEWRWIEKRPLFLRIGVAWAVVHGGVRGGVPLDQQLANEMVRMRYIRLETGKMAQLSEEMLPTTHAFWTDKWTGPENIVYGHHVVGEKPAVDGHPVSGTMCMGIDTGCCFGKALTCAIFKDDIFSEFQSVPAKQTYAKLHGDDE